MGQPVGSAEVTFADVICADPEWVAAEFDALVAASFGQPPASPPPAPPGVPFRPRPPGPPSPGTGPGPVHPLHRAVDRSHHRRQRSPPPHV